MSGSHLNYTHHHMFLGSAHDENAKRTLWVVALTVVMMIGEIIAGYITGSMALLADGFHMATHADAHWASRPPLTDMQNATRPVSDTVLVPGRLATWAGLPRR